MDRSIDRWMDGWMDGWIDRSIEARVGMRRSALMYRLLKRIPPEELELELSLCGVSTEDLDHEGVMEAIIEQLL